MIIWVGVRYWARGRDWVRVGIGIGLGVGIGLG